MARGKPAPGQEAEIPAGKCVRGHVIPPAHPGDGPRKNPLTLCGKAIPRIDTYSQRVPAVLLDGVTPDPRYPDGTMPDPRLAEVEAGLRGADADDRWADPPWHLAPHENLQEALLAGKPICADCLKAIARTLGGG